MAYLPNSLEVDNGLGGFKCIWESRERSNILGKATDDSYSVFMDIDRDLKQHYQDVKRQKLKKTEMVETLVDFEHEPIFEIDLKTKRCRLEMHPSSRKYKTYAAESSLKYCKTLSNEFEVSHSSGVQNNRRQNHNVEEINKGIHQLNIDSNYSYWKQILKPDTDGDNLLFVSIIIGDTHIFHVFINLVPNFKMLACANKRFQTALHLAALTENADAVRRLIVAGVEVDKRDMYGNTALHIACKRGNVLVSNMLLTPVTYAETQKNIYDIPYQRIPQNLEIRNSEGLTCLLIAAYKNDRNMMELLLSKDADINAIDMKSGKTCLHIFAEGGNDFMIKCILSKTGINVNARTYAGFTAAELAQYRGHNFVVSQLLYAGIDPNIRPIESQEFQADSDCSDEDL